MDMDGQDMEAMVMDGEAQAMVMVDGQDILDILLDGEIVAGVVTVAMVDTVAMEAGAMVLH